MSRILYHTATNQLHPWPRADDEDIVGLEGGWQILTVTQEERPELQANQYLESTEAIDLNAGTVTRGYIIHSRPAQWANVQAFMHVFTMDELAAIGLSTDPTIVALRLILSTWLGTVEPSDERVLLGLGQLVALGIISEARKAEIIFTAS